MFRYVQSLHRAHFILWRESPSEERRIKNRRIWVPRIRLKSGFYSDTLVPTTAPALAHSVAPRCWNHTTQLDPEWSPKRNNANSPNISHSHHLPSVLALFFQEMGAVVNTPMQKWSHTILGIISNRVTLNFWIFKKIFSFILERCFKVGSELSLRIVFN